VRIPPYHWWRTVFFLIPAISVYTIVLGAASILSSLFDRRGYLAHSCARAWSWSILKTTGVRVDVRGLERLTPGATYVFVSNHQSHYDTPVIFSTLPFQLRIIAKESLARFPVLGWHLKRGGHLFVDRRRPDRAGILKRWKALVSEGLSLIIYAEGTRSPDGHVARFRAGSFLLAIEAGLPIVPLAVVGSRSVMPKGRLQTEPGHVTLIVHDPMRRQPLRSRRLGTPRCSRTASTPSLRSRWRNCRMV
jgi:1-acyl-sn-glycerol-3-phosphate acyltransferase